MSERDPKLDPMPGDVLRVGKWFRKVESVSPRQGDVYYLRREHHWLAGGYSNRCELASWRKWASTAQVVKRAEE